MLRADRALALNVRSGAELPRIDAFRDLYAAGCRPRQGQVIMIAGRSGSQKSGLAMYWTAQMGLPTLYFCADMSPFDASARIAAMASGHTTEEIEANYRGGYGRQYDALLSQSRLEFAFGSPLTWRAIDEELEAYVELWNAYPKVIVLDNLMDFEGAEADYAAQMEVMQGINELARHTGATTMVLHHATDKSWDAKTDPWAPPSRDQIKGGMSEKPELSLSVALDPNTLSFRVAVIKQRSGPQDPTARNYVVLKCDPARTRFSAK